MSYDPAKIKLNVTVEIAKVREFLTHKCDGPITAMVLIARAAEFASKKQFSGELYSGEVVANALHESLTEYGYLEKDTELYVTGS